MQDVRTPCCASAARRRAPTGWPSRPPERERTSKWCPGPTGDDAGRPVIQEDGPGCCDEVAGDTEVHPVVVVRDRRPVVAVSDLDDGAVCAVCAVLAIPWDVQRPDPGTVRVDVLDEHQPCGELAGVTGVTVGGRTAVSQATGGREQRCAVTRRGAPGVSVRERPPLIAPPIAGPGTPRCRWRGCRADPTRTRSTDRPAHPG